MDLFVNDPARFVLEHSTAALHICIRRSQQKHSGRQNTLHQTITDRTANRAGRLLHPTSLAQLLNFWAKFRSTEPPAVHVFFFVAQQNGILVYKNM